MIKGPGEQKARTTLDLWDDEIDGWSAKPPSRSSIGILSILGWSAVAAMGCVPLMVLVAIFAHGTRLTPQEREFRRNLSAVNQRATRLGGRVSNGRRDFRHHVGAWFHGEEITDRAMPEIVSIIRECQARGLGGAHLSLDISRTSIGDDGIKLLHSVTGLDMVRIRDTNVTKDGVESLCRALPRTFVDAWPIYQGGAGGGGGAREQDP
jgi:hypothetical protein